MCKEKAELANYFQQSQERTAEACAISLRTVQKICKEYRTTENQEDASGIGSSDGLKFRLPRKKLSSR